MKQKNSLGLIKKLLLIDFTISSSMVCYQIAFVNLPNVSFFFLLFQVEYPERVRRVQFRGRPLSNTRPVTSEPFLRVRSSRGRIQRVCYVAVTVESAREPILYFHRGTRKAGERPGLPVRPRASSNLATRDRLRVRNQYTLCVRAESLIC